MSWVKKNIFMSLALCMLAQGFSGCGEDDDVLPDTSRSEASGAVTISFDLDTSQGEGSGFAEEEEIEDGAVGLVNENYIDPSTLTFYIYDGEGNFVESFIPSSLTPSTLATLRHSIYTVIATLNLVSPSYKNGSRTEFYIAAFANSDSPDAGATSLRSVLPAGATISTLTQLGCRGRLYLPETSYSTWLPSQTGYHYEVAQPYAAGSDNILSYWTQYVEPQGIPMFGFRKYSIATYKLVESSEEDPVNLTNYGGSLPMLRAMAKIQVLDDLDRDDDDIYPHISYVRVLCESGYSVGAIAPTIYLKNPLTGLPVTGTAQVSTPTYPPEIHSGSASVITLASTARSGAPAYITPGSLVSAHIEADGDIDYDDYTFLGVAHIGYIPEVPVDEISLEIVVDYGPSLGGEVTSYKYVPVKDTWGDHILRNHIYTFRVIDSPLHKERKMEEGSGVDHPSITVVPPSSGTPVSPHS